MKTLGLLLFWGCAGWATAQDTNSAPVSPLANPLDVTLQAACTSGDLREIIEMIDQGATPDLTAGENKVTPLMVAAARDLDVTRLLIGKKVKIDALDALGNSALNYACFAGQTDCALALLDAGAKVNLANKDGRTPLINAVRSGNSDLVKALLARHADVNANASPIPALVWAVNGRQEEIVKLLLDAGADVNLVPPAPDEQEPGYAALHAAAALGDVSTVNLLLDHHADVNLRNHWGVTPLMAAAFRNHSVSVQELLDHGAQVDVQSNDGGMSALLIAARGGYLSVTEALLSAHANTELKNKEGYTALILAAMESRGREVSLLVDNGADINATDALGETAFGYAVSSGDTEMADWLKDHGAKRTDPHTLAQPLPQPPLPAARAWALAVSSVYALMSNVNPNVLGYDDYRNIGLVERLQDRWQISDRASLLKVVDDLQNRGPRPDWLAKGAKVAALNDEQFKTFLLVDAAASGTSLDNFEATAVRNNYLKWKDRTGLAWSLCVAANLINRGYTLRYLDEKEAWQLLLANARLMQAGFGSWQEMSDNFLDGREISEKARDTSFEACSQLLLNPNDVHSPWNRIPWKTDLSGN